MKPDARSGILVVQSLGIGDLLFALPTLRTLKRHFPEEHIFFVTNAKNYDLLSLVPEVAGRFSYQSKSLVSFLRLIREVRRHSFRMVIVLNPIFRGSVLAWLSGAPVRIGYLRDYEQKQSLWGLGRWLLTQRYLPRNVPTHEVERYLDLARFMGLSPLEAERRPQLILTETAREFGRTVAAELRKNERGPLVALQPGAGWELRQWPRERFAEIADWMAEALDAVLVWVGSEEDRPLVAEIRGLMRLTSSDYSGATSLSQLAGLLAHCDLFLVSDTGSLHIAAALGTPTLALFGPGDPVKVRPLSDRAAVIHHPVPWGPCRVQYTNRCQNNLCMKDISVKEVQQALRKILGSEDRPFRAGSEPIPPATAGLLPKRVLYLQATSEIGGTDVTLLRTIEILDRRRFEPHVVLPLEGFFSGEYRRVGCRVHVIPSMRQPSLHRGTGHLIRCFLGYPAAVARIVLLIRREKIDLIHSNSIHNLYGFLAALLTRRPHVWHIREIVVQSRLLRRLERWLVVWFSKRFIVMDNAIAEMFLKQRGGFPANIVKLYDGVDLEVFHPNISGSRIRRELGIPEAAPLVGMVGRLDPAKGPDLFLETAARIHSQMPSCRFLICGGEIKGHEGNEAALRRRASELGLSDAVLFSGWRYRYRDIPEVYRALTLSMQCPRFPEAYGLCHIEAMACGTPVVAAAEGGPKEICVHGEMAVLVPPRDPAAAAEAALGLLQDPDKAQRFGAAGRQRAERLFDRNTCVQKLEKIYDHVLEERSFH